MRKVKINERQRGVRVLINSAIFIVDLALFLVCFNFWNPVGHNQVSQWRGCGRGDWPGAGGRVGNLPRPEAEELGR